MVRPVTQARQGRNFKWLERAVAIAGEDCVEWPFPYGAHKPAITVDGKKRAVSHIALELDGRPRPTEYRAEALHSCDNNQCVNPKHLRWGTHLENMLEWSRRGGSERNRYNRTATPNSLKDQYRKGKEVKVSIYQTIEITDEQRKEIGKALGVKWPDRDQLKEFFWTHGASWEEKLALQSSGQEQAAPAELDDLI